MEFNKDQKIEISHDVLAREALARFVREDSDGSRLENRVRILVRPSREP